ncbi:hypothetical protein FNW25_01395 [Flavobacterium franklandianum]|uniref:hypothetical protein n=1 Tax=Flavobacterium franklandianum TaxID=2594430 RepID=UPI00117B4276|nr:hypothetical protein [Flavobacterium franklandianum]TRX29641.1 hypothetical protein FNW25_01395 [Flavobacterium franklandianum]
MSDLEKLLQKRNAQYFSLICLKDEIKDYIKDPVETVSIDNLQNQYSFLLREINNLDTSIRTNLLTQIEWAKRDLKNLETQLFLVPQPFHISDLPSYSSIFK